MSAETRPFFHRVESLRGLGAVIVAAWHFSGWRLGGVQVLPHEPWPAGGALQNAIGRVELALLPGHAALMAFFVISGFVLRVSLQHGPQGIGRAAARFHVARLFRIYPVVAAGVLLAAIANDWQVPASAEHPAGPVTLSVFAANALLVERSMNLALWALQVELLMAPIIVALYFVERWRGTPVLAGIAVASSALSFDGGWLVWPPLSTNCFAFVLGMLVPTLGRQLVNEGTRSRLRWLGAGAVLGLFLTGPTLGFFSRFSALFEGYFAFVLVSLLAYRTDLRAFRVLDRQPMRLLGRASGSYYVLHAPLAVWILPAIAAVLPASLSAAAPSLAGPLVLAAATVVMALAAVGGFYAIEAPGIAVGRRISARWREDPPRP